MLESLFYKVASLQDCNVTTQVFSCEIWEILKNIYLQEHLNDCFCALITSHVLVFTVHVFHFYKYVLLYYAIKTIELMTLEAVSFEEVFH